MGLLVLDSLKEKLWHSYCTHYKALLLVPLVLVVLAIGVIGYTIATTGDFIHRDVSLKGGVTITIPQGVSSDIESIQNVLRSTFPEKDIQVRGFGLAQGGVVIDADLDINDQAAITAFLDAVGSAVSLDLDTAEYGIEFFGSSLGDSFFRESIGVLFLAFFFMALVVFVYFRIFIPSLAIVLAAVGDILVALAVVDLFEIKLGTAGIAAFLMLIGYSVDTDILLTMRVLKRREGTLNDRIISSLKTGLTQTGTSLLAITVALLFTQSEVIQQIMFILFVGLLADLVFTWIQNVSLLRYYYERKERAHEE